MKGICGKLLDIDLTTGKTKTIAISDDLAKKYVGGRGLGARLLYDLLPPHTDPLSPENIMIVLTGPLTGSMVCGSSKFVVVTKSPLTGGWCDSYSSGRTSIELKKAGYDGLVIRGKAGAPSYLKIGDRGAEIVSAAGIWGQESFDAERMLKEKEGKGVVVTSIGPAGENLCLYACINSDNYRQAARAGVGAVMGSKNLKAIVVRGSGAAEFHDRARVVELNRKNYDLARKSQLFQARSKYGTSLTLNVTNAGRNPPHAQLPVRRLGPSPGQARFGGGLQERQGPPLLPVLLRPLLAHDRGDRGAEQGGALRGAGIRNPRPLRLQPDDRFAADGHPGEPPLRHPGAGHDLDG